MAAEGVRETVKMNRNQPLRMMYRRPVTDLNKINELAVRPNLLRNNGS
jgi:hypothetical protein